MTASRASTERARLTGIGFAGASAFSYGVTVLFSRVLAKSDLPVPTVLGMRFGMAGALLAAALLFARRTLVPPKGERAPAALLGTIGYAVQSALFFSGLQRGTAAAVTLLFYSFPAIVVLLEIPLERRLPKASTIAALLMSSAGVAAIVARSGTVAISRSGALIALAAGGAFAVYVLVSNRFIVETPAPVAAMWVACGTALSILTFGLVSGSIVSPGRLWWAIVGNGLATAAAFAFLFAALPRAGASRVSVVMTLEALFAIVLTAALLGEGVGPVQALGGVAILAGAVVIATSGTRAAERPGMMAEV